MPSLPQEHTGSGLVDLQVNGYGGFDFMSDPAGWTGEELHRIREMLARRGVTAALPTLVTHDPEETVARVRRWRELVDADKQLAACFVKLHIEGPFISQVTGPRGAHPEQWCSTPKKMPDLIGRLREAGGDGIGIVTIAPELPGAIELIEHCAAAGICVAIGHTDASDEDLDAAVKAGAKMSTHLGNGSHQQLPRLHNYLQTQLADDRLAASFIADGHHMPFTTLKNFIRAKTPQCSILVTDAIIATEMPPGQYDFAGETVVVEPNGRCAKPGEENLAGSTLTLDKAVVNTALHCAVTFEQAWAMASSIPAALVGLPAQPNVTVKVTEEGFERK